MTLTEARPTTDALVDAARLLLHRGDDGGAPVNRNNVGFNGADYGPVRRILWSIDHAGKATPHQRLALARRLEKYGRQLGELGFDAEQLWAGLDADVAMAGIREVVAADLDGTVYRPDWSDEPEAEAVHPRRREIPPMADVLGPAGVVAQQLPGYEPRLPQIELSQRIADAIKAEQHLLGEAGTGVGKSLAYLVPAIASGLKVIVSTEGKALQDQLTRKDAPFLQSVLPWPFRFAQLKGLSNYLCLERFNEEVGQQSLFGDAPEWARLREWVAALGPDDTGDLAEAPFALPADLAGKVTSTTDECTGRDCPHYQACYAMRARQAAKDADVLVVNHTLLSLDLALRAKTGDGVSVLPDRDVVILDEAHALEEIATKAFTDELTNWQVPSLLRGRLPALAELDPESMARATEASREFFDALGRLVQDERSAVVLTPNPRLRELAAAVASSLRPLERKASQRASDPFAEKQTRAKLERFASRLDTAATLFAGILEDLRDTHVLYLEATRRERSTTVSIKLAPISVADDLHAALWSKWPVIAVSATLTATPIAKGGSAFGYVRERLGIADGDEATVPSPFDYRRNALIYLPPDGFLFDPSRYRQDGSYEYFERLAAQIEQLLLASDGRAFCLFTSRRAMDDVYTRIAHRLRWNVLRQGDAPPLELVRRFKEDGHAVLFGLRTFMTGVDVQGDALSLVIIDKLPFPSPDEPVYQARCDLVNRQTGDQWAWFNRLAIPICSLTFKQGAGRLIRTGSDRGVMALLDGRLTSKGYGAGILRSLPPAPVTRSIEAVRTFFAGSAA